MKKPLSIAVGDSAGLLDLDSVGKIRNTLDAKEVPYEIQV